MIRPGAVEWLSDCYRHKGTSMADLTLAHRHEDFTPQECAAALDVVMVEAAADLALLEAHGTVVDEELARLLGEVPGA